ncbi:MAG TPA: hypothetical protein VMD55_09170, partial [Terracidiphilus sp.]|nr:hypothetical protein [Terracidiphilus sp.]
MSTRRQPASARGTALLLLLLLAFAFLPRLGAQMGSARAALAADLERGQAALKAKDSAAAAEAFRDALRIDPTNAEAHANLGAIAFFK